MKKQLMDALQACIEWSESRDGSPEADDNALRTINEIAKAALSKAKRRGKKRE